MEVTAGSLIFSVKVHDGSNFATGFFSSTRPYLEISAENHNCRTRVATTRKDSNPSWEQEFVFVVNEPEVSHIKFEVLHRGAFSKDRMGNTLLSLSGLELGVPQPVELPLRKGGSNRTQCPTVRLTLTALNRSLGGPLPSAVVQDTVPMPNGPPAPTAPTAPTAPGSVTNVMNAPVASAPEPSLMPVNGVPPLYPEMPIVEGLPPPQVQDIRPSAASAPGSNGYA